jgi:predicted GNAT family acetyltransferase
MDLRLTRDPEEFSVHVEGFLAGRLEHNQLATTLIKARQGAYGDQAPLFAYGRDHHGAVCYAALRTPPWPMLTGISTELDADRLIELWLAEDEDLSGVIGELRIAGSLAGAWERATGGSVRLATRTLLQTLSEVAPPRRPASGRLRLAEPDERELLIEWELCFLRDVRITVSPSAELTDARLAEGAQFMWEDGGPVSTVVVSPQVAGTVRIGPVYTPAEHRGHGYATSAVAAVCERLLGSGAERCALFTDVENPTSKKIYAEVGFVPVADWAEYAFERKLI